MFSLVVTSAAASTLPPDALVCRDAIIGGGWAGVYFAYRRSQVAKAGDPPICLFEASDRIGGRTYSVPPSVLKTPGGHDEFVLDVGAYRFSPDMHLPGDLILNHLKLPTACYEPTCPSAKDDFPPPFLFNYSAPLRRIVNPATGLPSGYVGAIDHMLDRMDPATVKVFKQAALLDIQLGEASFMLSFGDNRTVRVPRAPAGGAVMLNLPRNKLLALPSLPAFAPARTMSMLSCVKFDAPSSMFPNSTIDRATALTKAYLYYEDAFWYTKLNLTIGQYPKNAFDPLPTSLGVYIGVHWNDGPVKCEGAARTKCSGYLQVYYAAQNETFYYGTTRAPDEPLGITNAAGATRNERQVLETVHAALCEALSPVLKAKGIRSCSELGAPSQLVVGAWSRPGAIPHDSGYTAPTKVYWAPSISGSVANACGVPGLTDKEYRETVLQPFGRDKPVYLANNDFVAQDVTYFYGDWAEETLTQSERALYRLGLPKPSWLNSTYYHKHIVSVEAQSRV